MATPYFSSINSKTMIFSKYKFFIFGLILLGFLRVQAQTVNCAATSDEVFLTGQVFFNYGSVTNAYNIKNKTSFTIGQPVVEQYQNQQLNGQFGFWSRFLLPPYGPSVYPTEGDLPDRIVVTWQPDPLSPDATVGFKIYRDGSFLAEVDNTTFQFTDFNVLPGQFYTYSVTGVNKFGEGSRGSALGFLNPNGVVTGQVKTQSGNPVADVQVSLTPTTGSAVSFGGDDYLFSPYKPTWPRNQFTVSCWVKLDAGNNRAGLVDFGSSIHKNWWMLSNPTSSTEKGVIVGVGNGTDHELAYTFPDSTKNAWHHIAMSYNGNSLLLYVDGRIRGTTITSIQADSMPLFLGRRTDGMGFLNGKMDELRIFNRQLSQGEIQMGMNRSVASNTPGLVTYWKMDEGVGSKVFDLGPTKAKGYFCGVQWSNDKPEVLSAGMTDATGFYQIEGINYGSGTTFTAKPNKAFHRDQSVEFNGVNQSYASLTNFDLPDTSSIEITVNAFDFSGEQVLLGKVKDATSNSRHFLLFYGNGQIRVQIGSDFSNPLFTLGEGFHRLSITLVRNGGSLTYKIYKDGVFQAERTVSGVNFDWATGEPWEVGRSKYFTTPAYYFTGLVDEVAFYDKALTANEIVTHTNTGTNPGDMHLTSYFNFNEGAGTALTDLGQAMTGHGTLQNGTWSAQAAHPDDFPHEFSPTSRLVTLNPSNTSSDGIDFTDKSTVPVSGFVRFDGLACFAKDVEILVNGVSAQIPIITDADGKFMADFEPGVSVRLTPKLKDHTFTPAFWDLQALSTPVSGLLFRDQTKRHIKGQIAGGECKLSIIPNQAIVKIKVASSGNSCFEKTITLNHNDNANGKYNIANLPPIPLTISVIEHSNPIIYNFFQTAGGLSTDLSVASDTVDFTYYAPPQVEMSELPINSCGQKILESFEKYSVDMRVFQEYDGGRCYLDSVLLKITNSLSASPQRDTMMRNGKFKFKFRAGQPNIVPPYLNNLEVVAIANGQQSQGVQQAVITGDRQRVNQFVSTNPIIPLLILRDPPGDGSYAYLEKGTTSCTTVGANLSNADGSGIEVRASIGPNITTSLGLGAEVELDVDIVAELTTDFMVTKTKTTEKSMDVCITTNEAISTSDNDLIVGSEQGGDVYMGGALNMIYGKADQLRFNDTTCSFLVKVVPTVNLDTFTTTYIYSEYFIKTNVLPSLRSLGDMKSVRQWERILADNAAQKDTAVFIRNLSFDAGIVYEFSETTDSTATTTSIVENTNDDNITTGLGLFINDVGFSAGMRTTFTKSDVKVNGNINGNSITTGYVLNDDDPGDNFTVDVLKDKKYGTPVFKTKAGQSSCPHEPKTQPRETVGLTVDKTSAVNIPANEAAVFKFNLGNQSQAGELRTYAIASGAESNADGAIIKLNGQSLLTPVSFQVPYGQSIPVTITVERGPIAYDYNDLEIVWYSECEDERAAALNFALDSLEWFIQAKLLDVHFIEPCSPVDISFPLPDWVITPQTGPIMNVTLGNYNNTDADLQLMRTQYRRQNGDGSWINVAETNKADLGSVFEIVPWNTTGLADGPYEVRSVSQCTGNLPAGISHVRKGIIERSAPMMLGAAQPADGVLSSGDEISITFTEPIRCNQLIAADQFNNNNVGLYDTETGNLIDATFTCSGEKIIIIPNVANQFLENKILRMEIDSVKDLAGNKSGHFQWEFFVDKNGLNWVENTLEVVKYVDQYVTVQRKIENRGGSAQGYEITGIPDWMNVSPKAGQLQPGQQQYLTFTFDSTMVYGDFRDTILMEGVDGDEPLPARVRVICRPPVWSFNPANYSYSMNFTVKLNIEGTLSTDEEDIVGAFINGEMRGKAKIKYITSLNSYVAFLSVYSNDVSGGDITLQIWDASECLLYGSVVEQYVFEADAQVGAPFSPTVLHTNNLVQRSIPLHTGWNWFSMNLNLPDPSINAAIGSLKHPENDFMKGQSAFSQYVPGLNQWVGSLTTVNYKPMYQYRADVKDTILMIGNPLDPSTVNIPVTAGWNWIGYIPQTPLTINEALSSLTPTQGDVIKGQFAFAQYVAGFGWIGNLQYLQAPEGYLLKLATPGTLTYPNNFTGNAVAERGEPMALPRSLPWQIEPSQYEHTMTMIGMIADSTLANITQPGVVLGAFVGDEVRGIAPAMYIDGLNKNLFFMTMYANTSGELLHFQLYDTLTQVAQPLSETFYFAPDASMGMVEIPQPFTLPQVVSGVNTANFVRGFEVYPNPFKDQTTVRFSMENAENVALTMTDALGRLVNRVELKTVSGWNTYQWNANSTLNDALSTGVYFIRLETQTGILIKKVVIEK
jgi:hypothetical protein